MIYPLFTVTVKAAKHSYSEAATFRRKALGHHKQYVRDQSEESIYKHGRFTCLEDWWHSLPDKPNSTTSATGSKQYWETGPMTNKNLKHWQDCDAAIAKGPTPAPMSRANREVLLQGRNVVVYDNVKEGKGQPRPAPHKYNPNSAMAADQAGPATSLGAAGHFRGMKNDYRFNAKKEIQRGDDHAPQKRWKGKGTDEDVAAPTSNPDASSSTAASAACDASWNASGWQSRWRKNEWQTPTKDEDAEMPEHSSDNVTSNRSSAEPHVPKSSHRGSTEPAA